MVPLGPPIYSAFKFLRSDLVGDRAAIFPDIFIRTARVLEFFVRQKCASRKFMIGSL